MPRRAKPVEEKKSGAATGIPRVIIPSAVNSLATVCSAAPGIAFPSILADSGPVSPPIPSSEIPVQLVPADEVDNGARDALEQLEGLRLTAGTEQAVESIIASPSRKGYNLRSTSRSSPYNLPSVTTDDISHDTGSRSKGTNRKEGGGGVPEANGNTKEGNKEEGEEEEEHKEEENEEEKKMN
ncbi:hypothetical protein N7G274_008059 [Stereocaulon virgatum]|uniref:Uncharacterized protein n=1 Tax=Stereocaulon virgatum TaxID=373712 RepID=A0ABR4A0M5_9LECA